jgi:hypothetical protein
MLKTRKGLLALFLLFLFFGGGASWLQGFWQSGKLDITIPEQRKVHILYGDERGGGHLAGVGKACKSEFPDDWSAERVIEETALIAANDNLRWARQDNGYYKAEKMVEDVRVRVIVDRRRREVVTAYPVNVTRNPCPAPANDNQRQR